MNDDPSRVSRIATWMNDDGSRVSIVFINDEVHHMNWTYSTETIVDKFRRWLHRP